MSAPLVERAPRLFEFLGRVQQLKTAHPLHRDEVAGTRPAAGAHPGFRR